MQQCLTAYAFLAVPTNAWQIVQYINIIKPDSDISSSLPSTSDGRFIYWVPGDSFGQDDAAGHGTHTAGSAAGATLARPADPVTCSGADQLSCVGGCIDADATFSIDDLASLQNQLFGSIDIDRICPMFGCGDATTDACLGDDVSETLTDHGGMAQGAKLAIFDVFLKNSGLSYYAGNGLWEACMDAGCKLHSNSYGGDGSCTPSSMEQAYDDFMYNVSWVIAGELIGCLNRLRNKSFLNRAHSCLPNDRGDGVMLRDRSVTATMEATVEVYPRFSGSSH